MNTNRELRIPVFDLGCGGAGATTIERALAATDGVLQAVADGGAAGCVTALGDRERSGIEPGRAPPLRIRWWTEEA